MRKKTASMMMAIVSMVAVSVNASLIFQEEFYVDGSTRTENMMLNGTTVGSTATGLTPTSYTWSLSGGGEGLNARYVVLGPNTTGDGVALMPNGDSNNYSSVANDAAVSGSNGGVYTLTTSLSTFDSGSGYIGLSTGGVGKDFSTQTGNALYIRLYGQDMDLVSVVGGTHTVLETMTGKNTQTADDTVTLVYDADAGAVSGSFINSDSTVSTFGTYSVGTLDFDAVKYQFDDLGAATSNFPRIEATQLEVVPEPATLGLLSFVAVGLFGYRRFMSQ